MNIKDTVIVDGSLYVRCVLGRRRRIYLRSGMSAEARQWIRSCFEASAPRAAGPIKSNPWIEDFLHRRFLRGYYRRHSTSHGYWYANWSAEAFRRYATWLLTLPDAFYRSKVIPEYFWHLRYLSSFGFGSLDWSMV
jgi:hypothetical protein